MVKEFLYSEKKIYDSVHGFIAFDELERDLIDSIPFQRLHYIHQLGIAYLVYPGATHTRFEHSLGVMCLATLMFEKICRSVRPDVFHFVPRKGSADYLYWRRVLRMAALCHDLGHLPFSHIAEKQLLGADGHEKWTLDIIESEYLSSVWDQLRTAPEYSQEATERDIVTDIAKIAIGEKKWKALRLQSLSPWEQVISNLITGDFFGADRIDYLLRDAKSTGVAYGLFDYHQLIETLRILPNPDDPEKLQLGIDENGLESCEALLLARHFMYRRVYQYSSVKAYNFHLQRYLSENFPLDALKNLEIFLSISDPEMITSLHRAARDPSQKGHRDAAAVFYRQQRFRAIMLPEGVKENDLQSFQKNQKIPSSEIAWEFGMDRVDRDSLDFPVSRRHMILEKAKDCSELLLTVPEKRSNWVYIAPQYDLLMAHFLEGK